MFDALGAGRFVSIDVKLSDSLPDHPRIRYIQGSSISHAVPGQVRQCCDSAQLVMVVLDAEHKADYKLKELRACSEFVTPGDHMVAEDSTFDFFPSWPEFGPASDPRRAGIRREGSGGS